MFVRVNESFAYTIPHEGALKVIQSIAQSSNPRAATEQHLSDLITLVNSSHINSKLPLQQVNADGCGNLKSDYFMLADSLLGMFDDLVAGDDSQLDAFDSALDEFVNVSVRIAISRCSF